MTKKIFISYAREDLATAKKLYADLKLHEFDPWLDEKNLLAGQNWRQFIPYQIKQSDYMILLLSDRSVRKRGFVQVEQKRALEIAEEFPDFDIFVIPVRLNDCDIPSRLADIHCTDLFSDYEKGLDKIIKALEVERKSDQKSKHVQPSIPKTPPCIYVSYSVIDNDYDWVSTFVHHLKSEIAKRMGTKDAFSIFMDQGASSGYSPVPAEIIEKIENAAMLIAVASPGYLKSERCSRERHTFLRNAKEAVLVESETIDENTLPDEFKALRPYRFWVEDRDGRHPRTLGHPDINLENDAKYFEIINDMSFDLAEKLKSIQPPQEIIEEPEPTADKSDLEPVFLAEVTDDLLNARDDMERYLAQSGFRVVPEKPPEMAEAAILQELKPCRVFVQLLSEFPGKSRADQIGKCRLQFECAQKAGKTILQWRSQDVNIQNADDDQRDLLKGPGVMLIGFEEFKKQAVTRAQFKISETPQAPDVMVFVNAEKTDETHAREVGQLMENRQIGAVLPIWESGEQELLSDMEAFILESHGVVVVYGNVHTAWVRKQILYCRSLNFRRNEPLKALGVYDAPAQKDQDFKQDLNLKLPGLHIINCRDCLNEAEFASFFDALACGGAS